MKCSDIQKSGKTKQNCAIISELVPEGKHERELC